MATSVPIGAMLTLDGHQATLWTRVPGCVATHADRRALGAQLARFHRLAGSHSGTLPDANPLLRLGARLATLRPDALADAEDLALLGAWRDRIARDLMSLRLDGTDVIRGDVHLGNAMAGPAGVALIDFDRIGRGARAWDLVQVVLAVERFGAPEESVEEFAAGYGADPRALPGIETLVRARALLATSWLLTLPRTPAVGAEIPRRLAYWRGDPAAPVWREI